jgi:hypothetical protein
MSEMSTRELSEVRPENRCKRGHEGASVVPTPLAERYALQYLSNAWVSCPAIVSAVWFSIW